ncbi:MAG: ribose-5-phosphate isomerase RpiA [Coriobacteriales bacterium]|nr:ribose-5-phosphate isomerase RpiA [Coriobacteriales bacterium]
MDAEGMKAEVARAALELVTEGCIIGIGSGSTVGHFVAALAEFGPRPSAAVAASRQTRRLLEGAGIPVVELPVAGDLELYVDSADEIDAFGRMIKGGGGALTMEKIVASSAERFACIVDESKLVISLGEQAAVPLEVIPAAVKLVERELAALGAIGWLREGAITDSGNALVDVRGLDLSDPVAAEIALDAIAGVVECGIFARRCADVAYVGKPTGEVGIIEFGE